MLFYLLRWIALRWQFMWFLLLNGSASINHLNLMRTAQPSVTINSLTSTFFRYIEFVIINDSERTSLRSSDFHSNSFYLYGCYVPGWRWRCPSLFIAKEFDGICLIRWIYRLECMQIKRLPAIPLGRLDRIHLLSTQIASFSRRIRSSIGPSLPFLVTNSHLNNQLDDGHCSMCKILTKITHLVEPN